VRILFSILKHNMGPTFILDVYKRLGIDVPREIIDLLAYQCRKRKNESQRNPRNNKKQKTLHNRSQLPAKGYRYKEKKKTFQRHCWRIHLVDAPQIVCPDTANVLKMITLVIQRNVLAKTARIQKKDCIPPSGWHWSCPTAEKEGMRVPKVSITRLRAGARRAGALGIDAVAKRDLLHVPLCVGVLIALITKGTVNDCGIIT